MARKPKKWFWVTPLENLFFTLVTLLFYKKGIYNISSEFHCSLQNLCGFDHAMILSPSFHGLRKECLAQWPAFCVLNSTKIPGGTSRKIGKGCAAHFLKPLPYFRPKSVIFPTLFQTWSKIWYPISDLKPWNPAHDWSTWQAVTARTQ